MFKGVILTVFLVLVLVSPSGGAVFNCPSGDVACLINAINAANATQEPDTIRLAAGVYTLSTVDNFTDGPNGLPSITTEIRIEGKRGPDETIIQRDPSLDPFGLFRIIHVSSTGTLILVGVAVKKGASDGMAGTGVFNRGTTRIVNGIIAENLTVEASAGIHNEGGYVSINESFIIDNVGLDAAGAGIGNTGTMEIERSTIARNCGGFGGGLGNFGTVTITNSAIVDNGGQEPLGGIINNGTMTIINSSVVEKHSLGCGPVATFARLAATAGAGGIYNTGRLTIKSSTIGRNVLRLDPDVTAGIFNSEGATVELQNTILASNSNTFRAADCTGVITSLGNNLIGDTTDCDIALLPSDLTGDHGVFTDDGTPGNGHIPLLVGSQAINAGDDDSCPKRDQIGNKRKKPCDIGAIEFRRGRPLSVVNSRTP